MVICIAFFINDAFIFHTTLPRTAYNIFLSLNKQIITILFLFSLLLLHKIFLSTILIINKRVVKQISSTNSFQRLYLEYFFNTINTLSRKIFFQLLRHFILSSQYFFNSRIIWMSTKWKLAKYHQIQYNSHRPNINSGG